MELITKEIANGFHCTRWEELPEIPLYMDQVIMIISKTLEVFSTGDEQIITSSMINNYVKHKLIPAPIKKKYDREQIAKLIFFSIFKRVFSINEISSIIESIIEQFGIEEGYNLFCSEFEKSIISTFGTDQKIVIEREKGKGSIMLRAALVTITAKLMVQNHIEE